jgi:uncharacterized membrane protein YciS (DUF1049 family)
MENWHLSKSVPVTFFLALVIQTVSVAGNFKEVEVGVVENAKDIVRNEEKVAALEKTMQSQEVRIARMDENIIHIRELLESKQ